MPHCVVPLCFSRSSAKSIRQEEIERYTKITFHRLPKAEQQRFKWATAVGLDFRNINKNAHFCSLHFAEDMFDRTSVNCVRLKSDAIPCKNKIKVQEFADNSVAPTVIDKEVSAEKILVTSNKTLLSSYHNTVARCSKSEGAEETNTPKTDFQSEGPEITTPEVHQLNTPKRHLQTEGAYDINAPKRQCINTTSVQTTELSPITSDCSTQTATSILRTPPSTNDKGTAISPDRTWDTPRKTLLRKTMDHQKQTFKKQMEALKKQNRRQIKKIVELKAMLNELRAKNLIADEQHEILKSIGMLNSHFLKRFIGKTADKTCKGMKSGSVSRQYSPELRTFAVTLHYYSPRAYNYVRKHFDSCLPHPKTINEWYRSINGDPGFISEAFACIAERVEATNYELVGTLVFDEMSIRQHVEYDGKKYCGYIDFGQNIVNDNTTVAKETLMFLFVCMNGAWKIPIAYFITKGVSADQKCNLILQSISFLHEAGVKVVALTFDGTQTNISVLKQFDCSLNPDSLQTDFMHPITKEKIFVIPDACHMVKLIRNTFGDFKVLIDDNGQKIEWEFIEKLHKLQTEEGLHAANKLRSSHINWRKQKMKVRLATQLFNRSVADSLKFCRENLNIPSFKNSFATERFLNTINGLFDIFNSKNITQCHLIKPLHSKNKEQIMGRLQDCKNFILNLRLSNGNRVVDSLRKTGFIGFLICISSIEGLNHELCERTNLLKYIPTYKMSQDHIELFFGCIRSQGGHNNNPTVRQLKSAIKKITNTFRSA